MKDEITEHHESFAQVSLSQMSCSGGENLYGSSARHRSYVTLSITPSKKIRTLSNTWYMPEAMPYIEVKMSNNQFAELITSFNHGSGVPATLNYLMGKKKADCPEENERERFQKEFSDTIKETMGKLTEFQNTLSEILEKPTINKADRKHISNIMEMVLREIHSNAPFVSDCFNDFVEKSVTEAKNEFDAHVDGKLRNMGLDALKNEVQLRLGSDTKPDSASTTSLE